MDEEHETGVVTLRQISTTEQQRQEHDQAQENSQINMGIRVDEREEKQEEEREGEENDHEDIDGERSQVDQRTAKFFDDSSNYNHQCYICDKIFSANSNLNRHLRKIHKENVQSPYNNVKCALCESLYSSSSIYNHHLETDHKVNIEIENLTFQTKESFEEWKHQVENMTTSQFIKSRGEKKTRNVNKTYFSCNRSGYYVSKARTRKALKKQGSRKINGRCPASMNVTVNPDSSYNVRFVKTHVGHDFELKHLDLSDKDRNLIVQKLASGVTKKELIKQIRSLVEQQQQICNASISPVSSNSIELNNTLQLPIVISNRNSIVNFDQIELTISNAANDRTTIVAANQSTSSSTPSTPIPNNTNGGVNNTPSTEGNNYSLDTSQNSSSSQQQPISRLHLATTKDLHNILNSKHLDPKKIRHNYDLNNVEAWMNEMKEFGETSSVLFYKNQSEKCERFPKLAQDDFIFIFMNHGQALSLKELGNKCIIIDSTHNVHCEYLHVAYISVVDDEQKALPVAFMFSTRTDLNVLEVFFTMMKDKVGIITTRMFIADELHDFYQAWWKIMSMPIHNLLSPWSVFEAWSKKFDTIESKEKLRKLKKQLRTLLTETETDKFEKLLKQVLIDYKTDQDVSKFIEQFEANYSRNPDIWSNCLRKNYNISNHQLLSLHEKFKSVYKEGKNSKKLCKYIVNLMNLYDDNQLERLAEMEDTNEIKKQGLVVRHAKSVESNSLVYEVAVEPVYWLCPSESSNEVYYEVKLATTDNSRASSRSSRRKKKDIDATTMTPSATTTLSLDDDQQQQREEEGQQQQDTSELPKRKCCDLSCSKCNACRHEYKCTCLDYIVNLNMCKHIHRICSMCR